MGAFKVGDHEYLIESDRTDHLAMHKGSALRRLRASRTVGTTRRRRRGKAS